MTKAAYGIRELAELGLGSQSHIRRMIKAGEIPVVRLGQRELVPSYWVEEKFLKPSEVK
ncbi:helix-turn-helix domain-containing protein [Rhodobacteraceae bacterium]|jgi:excisionase family DNA binding protein|nr:helix-turn-helix domain-containing protein [Paracoccaceae bacterium]